MIERAAPGSGKTAVDLPDDVFAQQIREGMDQGPGASAPRVMRSSLAAPYIYGTLFVHALRRRGGWPSVDRSWDDAPTTSEQIMHPEKWLAHEPALIVAAPDVRDAGRRVEGRRRRLGGRARDSHRLRRMDASEGRRGREHRLGRRPRGPDRERRPGRVRVEAPLRPGQDEGRADTDRLFRVDPSTRHQPGDGPGARRRVRMPRARRSRADRRRCGPAPTSCSSWDPARATAGAWASAARLQPRPQMDERRSRARSRRSRRTPAPLARLGPFRDEHGDAAAPERWPRAPARRRARSAARRCARARRRGAHLASPRLASCAQRGPGSPWPSSPSAARRWRTGCRCARRWPLAGPGSHSTARRMAVSSATLFVASPRYSKPSCILPSGATSTTPEPGGSRVARAGAVGVRDPCVRRVSSRRGLRLAPVAARVPALAAAPAPATSAPTGAHVVVGKHLSLRPRSRGSARPRGRLDRPSGCTGSRRGPPRPRAHRPPSLGPERAAPAGSPRSTAWWRAPYHGGPPRGPSSCSRTLPALRLRCYGRADDGATETARTHHPRRLRRTRRARGQRDPPGQRARALRASSSGTRTASSARAGRTSACRPGQMGNSEVGHLNFGAGRIAMMDISQHRQRGPRRHARDATPCSPR